MASTAHCAARARLRRPSVSALPSRPCAKGGTRTYTRGYLGRLLVQDLAKHLAALDGTRDGAAAEPDGDHTDVGDNTRRAILSIVLGARQVG